MHLLDAANSEEANESLTKELETVRKQIRSHLEDESCKADVFGRLLKKKGRQEAMEQELQTLRGKFLLPFACQGAGEGKAVDKVAQAAQANKLCPWQSEELQNKNKMDVHSDFLADALKPIALNIDQIGDEAFRYAVTAFPVELLTTRADIELFAAIREQLITEEAVRLIGLLSHFLYWIVLGHIHPTQLPEQAKQSMVLTIQELWAMIQAPARQRLGRRGELLSKDGPAGISFVIPGFMLALKRGVEWVFQQCHPWIFTEVHTQGTLIDQMNIMFMKLFDPDCLYASFGALEASEKAIKLYRKLRVLQASIGETPATRMIHQEYRTTPLMSMLMESGANAGDAKTRQLLNRSQSESMMQFGGGSSASKDQRTQPTPLDGWRRAALYRSANKRISGLQRAGTEAINSNDKDNKAKNTFMKSASTNKIAASAAAKSSNTRSSERTSTVGSESTTTIPTLPPF